MFVDKQQTHAYAARPVCVALRRVITLSPNRMASHIYAYRTNGWAVPFFPRSSLGRVACVMNTKVRERI